MVVSLRAGEDNDSMILILDLKSFIPSDNQTWQWKMDHLQVTFLSIVHHPSCFYLLPPCFLNISTQNSPPIRRINRSTPPSLGCQPKPNEAVPKSGNWRRQWRAPVNGRSVGGTWLLHLRNSTSAIVFKWALHA